MTAVVVVQHPVAREDRQAALNARMLATSFLGCH